MSKLFWDEHELITKEELDALVHTSTHRRILLRRCYVRLHSEFDEVNEDGLYDVELCDLLTEIEKELADGD